MRNRIGIVAIALFILAGIAVGSSMIGEAEAKIGGGTVSGPWRCERFGAVGEDDAAEWLATYAPGGPSHVTMAGGGEGGGHFMLCACTGDSPQ